MIQFKQHTTRPKIIRADFTYKLNGKVLTEEEHRVYLEITYKKVKENEHDIDGEIL